MKIKASVQSRVAGHFCVNAVRPDGSVRALAEFPNLITDWGLNRMASNGYLAYCHVGSGSTPPAFGDTSLDVFIAETNNKTSLTEDNTQSSPPYYIMCRNMYEFSEGVAEGNLSEVSIGISEASGSYTFSRALILDGSGDPTTITVLSSERLQVTYELRMYQPDGDITGYADGYSYTSRSANVTTGGPQSNLQWSFDQNGLGSYLRPGYSGLNAFAYEDGTQIGAITSLPSGASSQYDDDYADSYLPDTHERTVNFKFNTGKANYAGGISAFSCIVGWGCYQMEFSPSIPKTSNDELTISVTHSWGRYNSA